MNTLAVRSCATVEEGIGYIPVSAGGCTNTIEDCVCKFTGGRCGKGGGGKKSGAVVDIVAKEVGVRSSGALVNLTEPISETDRLTSLLFPLVP